MKTNVQKFTGKIAGFFHKAHDALAAHKSVVTTVPRFAVVALAFAFIMGILGVGSPVAAYSATVTPASFSCATAVAADQIPLVQDFVVTILNIVVTNWLTMLMIVVSVFVIVFGLVTGLFRRGKRRGR